MQRVCYLEKGCRLSQFDFGYFRGSRSLIINFLTCSVTSGFVKIAGNIPAAIFELKKMDLGCTHVNVQVYCKNCCLPFNSDPQWWKTVGLIGVWVLV